MKLGLAALLAALLSTACSGSSNFSDPEAGGGGGGGAPGCGSACEDAAGGSTGDSSLPSSDTGTRDSRSSADSSGATDTGAGETGKTPLDASSKDGGPDPACGMQTTQAACANCCATGNPSAVTTLNTAIIACACGSGPCSSSCATEVCVDVPAVSGDSCYSCLSTALGTGGPCDAPVQAACLKDPGCAAYLACEMAECTGKP